MPEPLRYEISDWHQLTDVQSNNSRDLSIRVSDIIHSDILTGLRIRNDVTGETKELKVDGAFLAVGLMPENEPFAAFADLNDWGYFDSAEDCATKTEGLFVAGDCRSKRIRQVTTAAADGAVAAMAACRYLG